MNFWHDSGYPIVISCAKFLTRWTEEEVKALGYKPIDRTDSVVVVKGNMHDVMKLNLHLRTAVRVLVPLIRCSCRNVRELYQKVYSLEWEKFFDPDGYFSVYSVVRNDTVRDTQLPSLVVKDAIADKMRSVFGRRPDSGPDYERGASVFLHWEARSAIVYIDTSGAPLSKRGYRKIPGSAPMQETLAAACIDAIGWNGKTPFLSPMCGSGTPAIEATLKAIGRAPGSLRSHFGFMAINGWHEIIPGEEAPLAAPRQRFGVSPELIWKNMVMEAKAKERTQEIPKIIATDISPEAVQNAQLNAHAAGVSQFIEFKACDFADTPIPENKGTIFFNPEYGIRLGTVEELTPVYTRIGEFMFEKCAGWVGGLITGNPELAQLPNLECERFFPFNNGPIKCRLFVYDGCRRKKEFFK